MHYKKKKKKKRKKKKYKKKKKKKKRKEKKIDIKFSDKKSFLQISEIYLETLHSTRNLQTN